MSIPSVEVFRVSYNGRNFVDLADFKRKDLRAFLDKAHELKKKIEQGMDYPGNIKITVIRETRAVDYAK